MAGLYIHIPFCRSKCAYCDFYALPVGSVLKKDPCSLSKYLKAILTELEMRAGEINEPINTIYIGGGTPTAVPMPELTDFISLITKKTAAINRRFQTSKILEFTIEANPEDISRESIDGLRQAGIDRISIGIQSFETAQLEAVMRRHDSNTSLRALAALKDSGINYSADLIYGLPGQSLDSWSSQIRTLLDFEPPHFSAYLLSYEPGTRLYAQKERGRVNEADEQTACRMYDILIKSASDRGYDHYEISNFSRPGMAAKHNSSYWNLTPYLGLGCSAHSFDGNNRRINPASLVSYMKALDCDKKTLPFIEEEETAINKVNDYIITSLRTSAGLSVPMIIKKWGDTIATEVRTNLSPFCATGGLTPLGDDCYRIPEQLWLKSDSIIRDAILEAD